MKNTLVFIAYILFLPHAIFSQICELKADIAILIDKSPSISYGDAGEGSVDIAVKRIELVKNFTSKLVHLLPLGENNTRVAITTFNNKISYFKYLS
jgi:hypothetical protein